MEKVTGIGGIFFKARDPRKLQEWYGDFLGITPGFDTGSVFEWREKENPDRLGSTVWSIFKKETKYFDPGTAPFMINYRFRDLHAILDQLRKAGATVDEKIEESEFGRFGWVMDPEGNRIELWEPPKSNPEVH